MVGSSPVAHVKPGDRIATSFVITIPADTPPGTYGLSIEADGLEVLNESFETNNRQSWDLVISAPPHWHVTLFWEAPVPVMPDIAGYRVYRGTASGVYDSSIDVGHTLTYVDTRVQSRVSYFWVVRAYTHDGQESRVSNEVSHLIP